MKKKITLLWRPAWLPLALLWLGGLLQSPQALAQEHRLDAKPVTPLRIVAPDPQPAYLPAVDVKRLLGKAGKSAVCDTVRVKLSDLDYVPGVSIPIDLIFVGEGEGTIDWGDGTQSACTAVEEAETYNWVTYEHSYQQARGCELTIYTSSPAVRIVGVGLYHFDDYTQYQLVERVDVRTCPSLMYLSYGYNQLKTVDVSQNTALKYLWCIYNRLTELDLSKNTALEMLNCNSNQLTSLDLSKNTTLETLYCHYNQLATLDLSSNTALTELYCFRNPIGSLDLSKNLNLEVLAVGDEVYSDGRGVGCNLSSLDLSKNVNLERLYCNNNQLTSLDLSKNTALTSLFCNNNRLTTLNVSKNTVLTRLDCSNNQLVSLDVSACTALSGNGYGSYGLDCSNNRLTSLDVSHNVSLRALKCSNNRLTTLDVSKNMKLEYLWCNDNELTSINVMEKPEDFSSYGYYSFDARNNRLGWAALTALAEMQGSVYLSPQQQTVELTLNGTLDLSEYMTYEGQPTVCDFSRMPASAYEWADGRLQIKQVGIYNFSMYNPAVRIKNGDSVVINWTLTVYPSERDTVRWTWKVEAGRKNTFYFDMFGDSTFVVNWGDGQDTVLAVSLDRNYGWPGVSHTYAEAGSYEVTVYGNSSRYMLTGLDFYYNHYDGNSQTQNRFDSLSINGANLKSLWCYYNKGLSMLDVSQCENLTNLYCYGNRLNSLDVSACVSLTTLDCSNNYLEALNISRNINLTTLDCSDNRLDSLDVSACVNLCGGYYYNALDNRYWYRTGLDCSNNRLTSLDISQNVNLMSLICSNNRLDSLDITKNTALTGLNCSNNALTSLDVTKNTALTELHCFNNRLASLDISQNMNLTYLFCQSNQLPLLDVTKNTVLRDLDCSNNRLPSLDVTKNTALTELTCSNNQLPLLDISKNTALTELACSNNALTSLDVTTNTALRRLDCSNNQLSSLDVSQCVALRGDSYSNYLGLNCRNNHLTSLDVSQNVNLVSLDCSDNQLDSLDLKPNTVLRYLYCDNNRLMSLAVSPDASYDWYELSCTHNRLPFENVAALSAIMQNRHAREYVFYPQSPAAMKVDLRQGLDLSGLVPTIDGVPVDFKIVLRDDTLSEGNGYSIKDGVLYFDKAGGYSIRMKHDAVKERIYSKTSWNYETRLYQSTATVYATVYDTLRMTWTAEAGETKGFSFEGSLGGYYVVNWGDGNTDSIVSRGKEKTLSHQYAGAGIYEVSLYGIPFEIIDRYVETAFGMEMPMVYVECGTFSMGATPEQGSDAYDDETVHEVTLNGFYIGRFEVTQAQWKAVMGTNPSNFKNGDDYPVESVSWTEAVAFCEKLSQMTGKTYRLPTEAEWEYAARGGQNADGTKYAGSNTVGDVAWYDGNSGSATHRVGQNQPNGLGLYDMSGNVFEWCSDWYDDYWNSSTATNPQGPNSGSYRVVRGGSWYSVAQYCRVSLRFNTSPGGRYNNLGFRVVCEL